MSLRPMDTELKRLMSPSLALLTLASITKENTEHEVYIEDENVKPIYLNDTPDIVGITVNVDTSYRSYEIAKLYKEKGAKIILGGIHISTNPEEAIKFADSICIGEGVDIWLDYLKDFENNSIKKIYKSNNLSNYYNIPIINWSFIDKSQYLYTNIITATKGCPFNCEFCYNSCKYIDKKYKVRNIDEIIKEIRSFNTKHIMFIDDNFIGDLKWTKQLIQEMKKLNIKWNAAVSTNIGENLDILDEMESSGCQSLFIGFETLNDKTIKEINKQQNKVEYYENTIKEIHSRNIMINASIVFGFDNDDKMVFKKTVDWLISQKIETMTAHILTPYPCTILYEKLNNENRIINFNWNNYNTSNVVFKPNNMSANELYRGYLWSYKYFYKFKNIIKRIPVSKKQIIPFLLFNLLYRKFGKIIALLSKFKLFNKIGALGRKLSYNIN